MITTIGFDLFGTVFDMAAVPRDELKHYGDTIRAEHWKPFNWPPSWESLPPFPDSRSGLQLLRSKGYMVVAMSNAPMALAMRLSRNAGINWDGIIALEAHKVYKPNLGAYSVAMAMTRCRVGEFLMVSANKDFGDIEKSVEVGCQSRLIRHPETLFEFAESLPARAA